MHCMFDYCIYNKILKCMLGDNINIDSLDMCEQCETVNIPAADIEKTTKRNI